MILKLLLSTLKYMDDIEILKNIIQIKNAQYWLLFDDMIADMLSNKKLNPVVI